MAYAFASKVKITAGVQAFVTFKPIISAQQVYTIINSQTAG